MTSMAFPSTSTRSTLPLSSRTSPAPSVSGMTAGRSVERGSYLSPATLEPKLYSRYSGLHLGRSAVACRSTNVPRVPSYPSSPMSARYLASLSAPSPLNRAATSLPISLISRFTAVSPSSGEGIPSPRSALRL